MFLEYTHYTFSPHNGLLIRTYSHARYDIALYTAFTPLSFFFLGIGMYYMHHDDVVDQWMVGTSTSYEIHSGVRSHVALYYLVGVYYTVSLSPLLSLSLGCYWRNQDRRTSDNVFPHNTSLRVGLMYTVGK